jgi:hypothetical protein
VLLQLLWEGNQKNKHKMVSTAKSAKIAAKYEGDHHEITT